MDGAGFPGEVSGFAGEDDSAIREEAIGVLGERTSFDAASVTLAEEEGDVDLTAVVDGVLGRRGAAEASCETSDSWANKSLLFTLRGLLRGEEEEEAEEDDEEVDDVEF